MKRRRIPIDAYDLSIPILLDFDVGVPMPHTPHHHGTVVCSCRHHAWASYREMLTHYQAVRSLYLEDGSEGRRYASSRRFSFAEVLHRAARRWPKRIEALGERLYCGRYGHA